MLITKFKTLFTNVDPNDIKLEYLKTARNLRLRDKATETKFYDSEIILGSEDNPLPLEITNVLAYKAIELDSDPLQSIIVNDRIVPSYKYDVERMYLLIGNDSNNTHFVLYDTENNYTVLTNPFIKKFTKAVIIKDRGNILILLDDETYWFGRLDRHVWIDNSIKSIKGYYLDRYLEPFDINNQGVTSIVPFDAPLGIYCKENRRLGFDVSIQIITDQTKIINQFNVTFFFMGIFNVNDAQTFRPVTCVGSPENVYVAVYRCRKSEAPYDIIQTPVIPDAGPNWSQVYDYFVFGLDPDSSVGATYVDGYLTDSNNIEVPRELFYETVDSTIPTTFQNHKTNSWNLGRPSPWILPQTIQRYSISKVDMLELDAFTYAEENIKNFGFDSSLTNLELVVTSILDTKEELITEYIKTNAGVIDAVKYGIQIDTKIPVNVNKRLTGIKFYLRFDNESDFVQVKIFNLIAADGTDSEYKSFTIGEISKNGIELVQTIGTLFDPNNFELIAAFDLFQRVNNISYAVKNNNVYGGVTGSGKVLDLFYLSNPIPDVTDRQIVYISNLNNIPAVHDVEKTTLILASDSGSGSISYSIRDIIGFVIKDQYDVAVSPDGIAIHTKEGIFLYNGNTLIPISKEINDLIELNFLTGKIFFNQFDKDLYYVTNTEFDEFYRYSFVDKSWTTHTLPLSVKIEVLQNISIDHIGNLLLISSNKVFRLVNTFIGEAELVTQLSDLGRPKEIKSFMKFRFDYYGRINFNGKDYSSVQRIARTIDIPISSRIPVERISVAVKLYDTTKIYSIEIIEESIANVDSFMELFEPLPIVAKPMQTIIQKESTVASIVDFAIEIPLVGNVTANTAIVVWATTHKATSRVIYGITPSTMTNEESSGDFEYYHTIVLTGLELEQYYYCQIYSTSQLTGEIIYSAVILFFTGKEITVQNILTNSLVVFSKKQKLLLAVENTLSEVEILNTLDPDGDGSVDMEAATLSVHTKVELLVENVVGNDFDYSVTP
jgi:hypothetical protein